MEFLNWLTTNVSPILFGFILFLIDCFIWHIINCYIKSAKNKEKAKESNNTNKTN